MSKNTAAPLAPSPSPHPAAADATAPATPRSRRTLWAFWAVIFLAFLAPSPGKMTFETKLGVALDPWRFIQGLGNLWQDQAGFGGLTNQYIGYAFPALPFYALADLAQLPVWVAERLWLSIIVTTAFWGATRLAERLQVGTATTRLLGAAVYALWPTYTIVVGSTSAAALPGAMLPWVLLPLTSPLLASRAAAARSAVLVPFMGGVNAASTLASLLPVGLYLLSRPGRTREQRRRKWSLIAWWAPFVALVTLWWTVPLLLLGAYGEDFMPYVEQADTTTATMSATELLRGAGNWVGYLHFNEAWLPAGWTVAATAVTVLCSAFAAALGLGGLARRDLPERRWLMLTVLAAVLITLAGYGGSLGGPFHDTVQTWLNGPLKPFRNIYKFQPGLALALTLGIAHLTATATAGARTTTPTARRVARLAPALAALLTLPGLAWPYLNGTILQPGAFERLPDHWSQTANWLAKHAPDDRALVVPATAHGTYTWGYPIDQPLDVLARSRWAQRDFVPFGTPGSRRTVDAVEQALTTGGEVPGLRDFLGRAGLHHVVVRNDLDPDQIGYVPPQTVKATLEASGYRRVAQFGPVLTGGRIPDDTPLQIQGLFSRQQAVEIYEPNSDTPQPGRVAIKPASGTVAISGGPEALLQLSAARPELNGRPTVLTGDPHPGVTAPPVQAVADGMRRADTRFGLVNANTSYTYTPDERNHTGSLQNPGAEPHQILPATGNRHQTTAQLRGAKSVTASSSGSWLFHLPQYDPVHAFDANPDTAWAEGSSAQPVSQWLRIDFDKPTTIPSTITVTPLRSDGMRAAPTRIRVQTDRGSADSPLQPNGLPQTVNTPAGTAQWLKIIILDATAARPGLSGAGFTDITIPGVQVARLLDLPRDADSSTAPTRIYSLHRGNGLGGLPGATAETGLHRQFRTEDGGPYTVTAKALATPGEELDRLLDRIAPEQREKITATTDSTSPLGRHLSPRNLVDADLSTAWIAGDRPNIHLRWPGAKEIDEIVFVAAGGISTRPEEVMISSPAGAVKATVDSDGRARFAPLRTDRLDITISKAAAMTVHNPVAGGQLQLPVGLSEIHIPALEDMRVARPEASRTFTLPCGEGPPLAVDGTLHATKASGQVRDLTERRPITVELCAGEAEDGSLQLTPGQHRVEAGDEGPLGITDVTLISGDLGPEESSPARTVEVKSWSGDRRAVTVGAGDASYLQTFENVNEGWKATLNGQELTSLRIDGWQQAWLIPAGEGGTVRMEYTPAKLYSTGLAVGAAGVLLVAILALFRGRRRAGHPAALVTPATTPLPGRILGLLALTVVMAAVAGWLALIVPAMALVATVGRSVLVPVATAAMAGAGIIAAAGAGEPAAAGQGAFSAAAQALALIALTAALVTVTRPANGHLTPAPDSTDPVHEAPASSHPSTAAHLPHQSPPAPATTQAEAVDRFLSPGGDRT